MNLFRGIVLIGVGVFALYQGWHLHAGERAWFAYGLGVLAMALGVWRLRRNPNKPLLYARRSTCGGRARRSLP